MSERRLGWGGWKDYLVYWERMTTCTLRVYAGFTDYVMSAVLSTEFVELHPVY